MECKYIDSKVKEAKVRYGYNAGQRHLCPRGCFRQCSKGCCDVIRPGKTGEVEPLLQFVVMLQDEDFKEEGVKLIFVLQGRKSSSYELRTVITHTDPFRKPEPRSCVSRHSEVQSSSFLLLNPFDM